MFKRVILEQWQEIIPYAAFAITGGVFLFVVIRSLLMKPSETDKLSHLPFDEGEGSRPKPSSDKPSSNP